MQILYAPPAAAGVSQMVAVSGDETYLYPVSGLLPSGGTTLDYMLWAGAAAGLGYLIEKKDDHGRLPRSAYRRLAMYAAGGVVARLIL